MRASAEHYTPGDWCSYEGGSGSVTCRLTCSQLTCHSQGKVASALRWVRRRVGHTDPSASVLPTRASTRACSRPPRRGGVQRTPDAPRTDGLGRPASPRTRHAPAQYRAHTAYARAHTRSARGRLHAPLPQHRSPGRNRCGVHKRAKESRRRERDRRPHRPRWHHMHLIRPGGPIGRVSLRRDPHEMNGAAQVQEHEM